MSKTTSSPLADLMLARLGVRKRPVGAGGDDRRERGVAAELSDPRFGGAGDVALAAAAEAALERPAPDLVGNLRGGGDRRELRLVLDPPQLFRVAAGGDQLDPVGEFLLEPLQRADREVLVLEPDPAGEARSDPAEPVVLDRDHLPALDLGLGPLGVAEVGEEEAGLGAADADPVGAGEPGQVADVDEVGDEGEVELALGDEVGEAVAAGGAHFRSPRARTMAASASR